MVTVIIRGYLSTGSEQAVRQGVHRVWITCGLCGERVWWVVPLRQPGDHEQGFPATVLRAGKVKATIICAMNGTGHWYPQNCRIHDLRPRTEYLAVDVIADTALKRLP
jgi:hypothetical protein